MTDVEEQENVLRAKVLNAEILTFCSCFADFKTIQEGLGRHSNVACLTNLHDGLTALTKLEQRWYDCNEFFDITETFWVNLTVLREDVFAQLESYQKAHNHDLHIEELRVQGETAKLEQDKQAIADKAHQKRLAAHVAERIHDEACGRKAKEKFKLAQEAQHVRNEEARKTLEAQKINMNEQAAQVARRVQAQTASKVLSLSYSPREQMKVDTAKATKNDWLRLETIPLPCKTSLNLAMHMVSCENLYNNSTLMTTPNVENVATLLKNLLEDDTSVHKNKHTLICLHWLYVLGENAGVQPSLECGRWIRKVSLITHPDKHLVNRASWSVLFNLVGIVRKAVESSW